MENQTLKIIDFLMKSDGWIDTGPNLDCFTQFWVAR